MSPRRVRPMSESKRLTEATVAIAAMAKMTNATSSQRMARRRLRHWQLLFVFTGAAGEAPTAG